MAVTQSPPPPPDGHAEASATPPISPVQSRIKWMELATRLLLFASIVIFAWTAVSALARPAARRLMQPISFRSPNADDEQPQAPIDFFQGDDEFESEPRPREPFRGRHGVIEDDTEDDDNRDGGGKIELRAASARMDAKLYGQPSERSVEMGEVRAGETIFVMKESGGWVLVLRGEGAMMGWMRRDNVDSR
ncbi:MAG: hypothetical protein IPM54_42265 [Polyangiaceae bacterium]|nr:hypothetical protein [Polyangiaceae bacterium]